LLLPDVKVVRSATNPRVFARPDTTDAVLDYLDVLLITFDRGFGRYPRLRWRSLPDR